MKALSTRSATLVLPVIGAGSMRRPWRNLLCFFAKALPEKLFKLIEQSVKQNSRRVEVGCQLLCFLPPVTGDRAAYALLISSPKAKRTRNCLEFFPGTRPVRQAFEACAT